MGIYFADKPNNPSKVAKVQPADVRAGESKYTNPLLECDQGQAAFTELAPFKDKVTSTISDLEQNSSVSNISVYFRDMNNGPWFDINGDASFSPASLLKVPLAMAYYKVNEKTPGILQKTITYKGPDITWPDVQQTILPKESVTVGQTYTMEELIHRMLSYSDNIAYYLLFTNINTQDLVSVYNDFSIKINGPGTQDDSIVTVKKYSGFFRMLFNASYLDQTDSEKILSFLAETDFQDGLVAGVPSQIAVAHKFGERELKSQLDQLHDCGIVYYPKHPYLLCVMTKGENTQNEANAIKQISTVVYSQVDSQNSGN